MNVASNYSMVLNENGEEGPPVKVEFVALKKGAVTLRALNHKLRQQIVKLIDENKRIIAKKLTHEQMDEVLTLKLQQKSANR